MSTSDFPRRADYAVPVDPAVPPRPALVDNHLDLTQLTEGTLTRLFVELVGDGLACGIRLPLLVARGVEPGPVIGITAAVHGNELNGIPVIHDLFRQLDPTRMRGAVVGVVAVNVPGLHLNQRLFREGADLNHVMPGREGGNEAQVFAARLLDRIVSRFDRLIDLHTASFGRVNSLYARADLDDDATCRMAALLAPQIVLYNPPNDQTLRGAASHIGIPAITVEVGDPQRFQDRFTDRTVQGLLRIVVDAGVAETECAPLPEHRTEVCLSSSWMYTDRGGLLQVDPQVTEHLTAGQEVARVSNAFGDVIRRYQAPADGIVIGRSVNPVGQTGARILHLGELAAPDSPYVTRVRATSGQPEAQLAR